MSVFSSFQQRLATPIIITASIDEEALEAAFVQMMVRSFATTDFLNGEISPTEYVEALEDNGVDSSLALEGWSDDSYLLGM